jgi:DNA-binding transcriptional regulator YhcF (GntR family)
MAQQELQGKEILVEMAGDLQVVEAEDHQPLDQTDLEILVEMVVQELHHQLLEQQQIMQVVAED